MPSLSQYPKLRNILSYSIKIKNTQGYQLYLLFLNTVPEDIAKALRQEKLKRYRKGEEKSHHLYLYDMILYQKFIRKPVLKKNLKRCRRQKQLTKTSSLSI